MLINEKSSIQKFLSFTEAPNGEMNVRRSTGYNDPFRIPHALLSKFRPDFLGRKLDNSKELYKTTELRTSKKRILKQINKIINVLFDQNFFSFRNFTR